jgi:hypothetical protein
MISCRANFWKSNFHKTFTHNALFLEFLHECKFRATEDKEHTSSPSSDFSDVAHRQRQILTSNKGNDLFRLFGSEGTIDELLEEVRSTAFIRSFVRTLTKPNAVQEPCVQ